MTKLFFLTLFLFYAYNSFSQQDAQEDEINDDRVKIVQKDGKFGLINSKRNAFFLQFEYDNITEMSGGYYFITKNKLVGIYNLKKDKIEFEPQFDQVKLIAKSKTEHYNPYELHYYFIVEKNKKFGILNSEFKFLLNIDYDKISCNGTFSVSNIIFRKEKLKGLIALGENDIIFDAIYDSIYKIINTGIFILKEKNNNTLVNNKGNILIENFLSLDLCNAEQFTYGVYYTVENQQHKKGLFSINEERQILPFNYDDISFAKNNLFIVTNDKKMGVIDNSQKVLLPFKYDLISICYNKNSSIYFVVKNKKTSSLINLNESIIYISKKDVAIENINNFFAVKENKKTKIINSRGKKIFESEMVTVGDFAENKCSIFFQDSMLFIDTLGNIIPNSKKKSFATGYLSLEKLCSDLISILKSENDSLLMKFCSDIALDENSLEYQFRSAKFKYGTNDSDRLKISLTSQISFEKMLAFRKFIKSQNNLQDIKLSKITPDKIIISCNNKTYEVYSAFFNKINGYFKLRNALNDYYKLRDPLMEY